MPYITRWLMRTTAVVALTGVVSACEQQARDIAPGAVAPDAIARGARDTLWIDNAWIRAGDSGAVTGAYATVHNPLDSSAEIIGARSAIADTVELHETMQHDGMVHMAAQTAVLLPSRDSVLFAPGGKHLMLRGLRRALVQGETVSIQLLLNNGDSISAVATVRSITGQ